MQSYRLYWFARSALVVLVVVAAAIWAALPAKVAPATAWSSTPASGPFAGPLVGNFGEVEHGILYRSAQPRAVDLLWLRSYGIRSVLNLREQRYDDGAARLANLGFSGYLHMPIDNYAAPTDAQAIAFLAFVQDQRNWPVLVHCAEGKGRTGVLVALARYAIDGWTLEQALAEANNYTTKTALSQAQRDWLAGWANSHAPGAQRSPAWAAAGHE